ncbi:MULTISPECIES: hypothetical protein [Acinetobacter]|jgi:hypothetical protein|uniref:hypothetical protein n=1 Tax=Acinetobacter TaxID=469 RepID=UPI0022701C5A|nr:hypothetical protein [Acinetobacter baumannii]MCY0274101.1 hypothetical protein [Acinetobacter baumannii]
MDKCREEFEAYFKDHHADSFYSVDVALEMRGDDYIDFLASDLWAIWQHQQAKVEEANAKAQMCRDEKNHAINRWSAVCKERDELQKRVDAAIKCADLNFWNANTVKAMVEALKGEGND